MVPNDREKVTLTPDDVGEVPAEVLEPKEKFPELKRLQETLQAEREAILKSSATLREQREALVAEIQPLELKLQQVNKQIIAIERPRLGEIDNQLGAIAKAMGGRAMSQPATDIG